MHTHSAYFWLNDGLPLEDITEFERGLESLTQIPLVMNGYFGKPADTNRSVVDRTYSYGLILQFIGTAEQNEYQGHPIHQLFVDANSWKWNKVVVYDLEGL